jgi:hypothetical protein
MLLGMAVAPVMAQSSMTDNQVAEFVQKEVARGTSQAQIVTKLMQNGVDITQIRCVRKKYQRQINDNGLGEVNDKTQRDTRLRTNNAKNETSKTQTQQDNMVRSASTTQRIQGNTTWQSEYNENDADFVQMSNELDMMTPTDSIKWLRNILDQQKKNKRKVFGRDIFNNKDLTFEPAMNIATPQNTGWGRAMPSSSTCMVLRRRPSRAPCRPMVTSSSRTLGPSR